METSNRETQQPIANNDLLLCRVCGEWVDCSNLEDLYDHLEHTTGSSSD